MCKDLTSVAVEDGWCELLEHAESVVTTSSDLLDLCGGQGESFGDMLSVDSFDPQHVLKNFGNDISSHDRKSSQHALERPRITVL